MKRNSICPKCGGNRIVVIPSKFGTYNKIKIGLTAAANVTRYICTDCGYLEQYLSDETTLRELYDRHKQS